MTSLIVKIVPNSMYQPIIAYDTAQLESYRKPQHRAEYVRPGILGSRSRS
jgi:hypothetical protein